MATSAGYIIGIAFVWMDWIWDRALCSNAVAEWDSHSILKTSSTLLWQEFDVLLFAIVTWFLPWRSKTSCHNTFAFRWLTLCWVVCFSRNISTSNADSLFCPFLTGTHTVSNPSKVLKTCVTHLSRTFSDLKDATFEITLPLCKCNAALLDDAEDINSSRGKVIVKH